MESINKLINNYKGDEQQYRDQIFIALQDLLMHPNLNETAEPTEVVNAATGLIFFKIGHFCYEIGFYQDAQVNLIKSLEFFNLLNDAYKLKFFNLFQETFNCLGIMEYNEENNDKSILYLMKAVDIYKLISETLN